MDKIIHIYSNMVMKNFVVNFIEFFNQNFYFLIGEICLETDRKL